MTITTNIYKGFQTAIPAEIRDKLNVKDTDTIHWDIDEKNEKVIITFKAKPTLHELSGMGKTDKVTDAIDLKHKSQRGQI